MRLNLEKRIAALEAVDMPRRMVRKQFVFDSAKQSRQALDAEIASWRATVPEGCETYPIIVEVVSPPTSAEWQQRIAAISREYALRTLN